MAGPKRGLHVTVVSRRIVKASNPTMQPSVVTFSNLDLIDDVQMFTVCVYPKPPTGDFKAVTAAFETHMPSFLNYFSPLAGRVVLGPSSGLPELHCHNQGAELIVADAGVELCDLDWSLADSSVKNIALPYAEEVALSLQLVSFTCGGFAVVWAMHHMIGDGSFAAMVIRKWSELVRSGTISGALPSHDRSVIPRPRDPPSYGASVAEMLARWEPERQVNALTAEASFTRRLYYVDASDIARLREMASASRAEALSAYVWKVLAGVVLTSSKAEEDRCRMVWYVDGRRRLSSPELLRNYTGNVVSYAMGDAAVGSILGKPLADVAAMVRDAITEPNYDELFQDMVDWVQVHKPGSFFEPLDVGLGSPTLSLTTWASYPIDTDFGFGHAMLALPLDGEGRSCSGHLYVTSVPGEPASWIIYAYIWPRLAAALESDEEGVFKPLTADYLGLAHERQRSRM